jgi:7-cyano-7-deazaguanine synthase
MAVILLSGGLDSALNLALAARDGKASLALTMRYGQRAESPELLAAERLANHYGARWKSLDVSWLGEVNPTSLTRKDHVLPRPHLNELDSMEISNRSAKAVWVANRNGLFLNVAAAYAEALNENEVFVGFNREEAATFPDNSAAFMEALNKSLSFSTMNQVKIASYTLDWDKSEIMAQAVAANLPLDLVWSCYEAGPDRCWQCESCKRSERALLSAGSVGKDWLGRMGWYE